jgi:FKBP-type peptidyl-prolyl cis-trans isomerase FklB
VKLALALLALQAAAPIPIPAGPLEPPVVTTASGLRFQVLAPGNGRRPGLGDAVLVTYQGRLADGRVFDAAEQPVGLKVADTVPGFTEALLLMSEGGRYRFWVPPALAYGAQGSRGVVPPNAELDFTLTLHRIGRPAAPRP